MCFIMHYIYLFRRPYAVVYFPDENSTSVVPVSWLTPKMSSPIFINVNGRLQIMFQNPDVESNHTKTGENTQQLSSIQVRYHLLLIFSDLTINDD